MQTIGYCSYFTVKSWVSKWEKKVMCWIVYCIWLLVHVKSWNSDHQAFSLVPVSIFRRKTLFLVMLTKSLPNKHVSRTSQKEWKMDIIQIVSTFIPTKMLAQFPKPRSPQGPISTNNKLCWQIHWWPITILGIPAHQCYYFDWLFF